jgi:hypothetical protein
MKTYTPSDRKASRRTIRLALALSLILGFAALFLAFARTALADAGPFPTNTPTQTSTLIPTLVIPTPIVLTIIPSQQGPVNVPEATQPVPVVEGQVQAPPAEVQQVEEDAPAPSAALACWPIAIIMVLAIILGGSYLVTRGRGG